MGTTDHSSSLDQAGGRNVRGRGTARVKPWYDGNVEVPSMTHETIVLHGHIIDSLLLPKVLDRILQYGGVFRIVPHPRRKNPGVAPTAGPLIHCQCPHQHARSH